MCLFYFSLLLLLSGAYGWNPRPPFDEELYLAVLDDELCDRQLTLLTNNSLGFMFLDSSGKFPSGILSGNLNELGSYWQCLAINQPLEDSHIQGKYCSVSVSLNQLQLMLPGIFAGKGFAESPEHATLLQDSARSVLRLNGNISNRALPETGLLSLTLGICVPAACSPARVVQRWLNLTIQEKYCRLPNDKPTAPVDYISIGLFTAVGIMTVVSTASDLYYQIYLNREISALVGSFSVVRNTRRLLLFPSSSSSGTIKCLDGIRALSMIWIVLGHSYAFAVQSPIYNTRDIMPFATSIQTTWLTAAPYAVDTFFAMSGMLCVYTTIEKICKEGFARCIPLFYLHRLLRMTPLLATMVLLQASMFHHVADGPRWQTVASAVNGCRQNWWLTLLHVQNYFHKKGFCLAQTWYLSVDTQLYFLFPVVLFFLFGRTAYAWSALTAALLLSLLSSTLYSYLNNFPGVIFNPGRLHELMKYFEQYYVNTLPRAPPFCVGMIFGYLLHSFKNRTIRIPKIFVLMLWVVALLILLICSLSAYPMMQIDHTTQWMDNFLNAYSRAFWAVAIGWIVFACHHGHGGLINWSLSLELWRIPARLSYAVYLVHYSIILIANGALVTTRYFTPANTFYHFCSDISLSFLAAFVLCLLIDAPATTLQKLLLSKLENKQTKPHKSPRKEDILDCSEDNNNGNVKSLE